LFEDLDAFLDFHRTRRQFQVGPIQKETARIKVDCHTRKLVLV
jgi:hypothetical protein